MSNKKISQMTYKQLAADDQFPTVNGSSLDNFYAFGGDISLLVGILQWDASAIYTSGQIVIYNGAEVKGMFLVNNTTSAGDAPDGTGYTKFQSIGLSWVRNDTVPPLSNASPNINIGYLRTKEIRIDQTPSTTVTYTITSNLSTHIMGIKVNVYTFNDMNPITVNYIDVGNGVIKINITNSAVFQSMKVMIQIDG
jgi:hypothetical protein